MGGYHIFGEHESEVETLRMNSRSKALDVFEEKEVDGEWAMRKPRRYTLIA